MNVSNTKILYGLISMVLILHFSPPAKAFSESACYKLFTLEMITMDMAIDLELVSENIKSSTPYPYQHLEDIRNDGKFAFVIGGYNSTYNLRQSTSITGVTYLRLDKRAENYSKISGKNASFATAPGDEKLFDYFGTRTGWFGNSIGKRRSSGASFSGSAGWMQRFQKIKALLIADNLVVERAKTTHQKLAGPMLNAIDIILKKVANNELNLSNLPIIVDNRRDSVLLRFDSIAPGSGLFGSPDHLKGGWVGAEVINQGSFFNDQIFADTFVTVTNLKTGKTLRMPVISLHKIYRYGFYQGGPFRVPPETLIDFYLP